MIRMITMIRMMKWTMPLVALALVFSLSATAKAQDAAKESGTLSGTVVDKDGKAVAGVNVRLFHPLERGQRGPGAKAEKQNAEAGEKPAKGEKAPKGDRPKPVATATTDAEGKFSMTDVPVGKYTVIAMLRGQGGARQDVEVTAGGDAKAELKLKHKDSAKKGERGGKKKTDAPAAE